MIDMRTITLAVFLATVPVWVVAFVLIAVR